MKSSLAQSSATLMRVTLRLDKRKRRLSSVFLCLLFFLSACGEASPDPKPAPAQETQAAVTRMVSEPVAADFFARVTDVCGGELYAIADGALTIREAPGNFSGGFATPTRGVLDFKTYRAAVRRAAQELTSKLAISASAARSST